MIDSPHNNLATKAQQEPYNKRSAEWLNTLVHGEDVSPRSLEAVAEAAKSSSALEYIERSNKRCQLPCPGGTTAN